MTLLKFRPPKGSRKAATIGLFARAVREPTTRLPAGIFEHARHQMT